MNSLFVGNLPFSVNDGTLMSIFINAGLSITTSEISRNPDGTSKGWG